MSRSPVLGIDLGTTNSVAAVADGKEVFVIPDEQGQFLTPSAVSFHPTGEVLVGRRARDRRMVDAPNTVVSVKRLIGRPFRSPEVRRAASRLPFKLVEGATGGVMIQARGETYSLPEISAFVLRRLKASAEQALGQTCVHAVVTVPANFNELQRTATRDAGRIAGLNVLRILNEPTAAALAYGYGARQRGRVAVYDLGGGTFDVSVLDLSGDVIEVIGTAGDTYLGGDDVDIIIADRMAETFLREHRIDLSADPQASARLRMAAEWLKCALSERSKATATLQEIAHGPNGKALSLRFEMARSELEPLCTPLFGRTFDICEQALKLAGVRPAQLDAVVLVGGQTRTPQVRAMVAEYFGREPLTSLDPDQVVAQGAALQALSLSGGQQKVSLSAPPPAPESSATQTSFFGGTPGAGFEDAPTRVGARSASSATLDFEELPTTVGKREARASASPAETPPTQAQRKSAHVSTRTGLAGLPTKPEVARALSSAAPKPPPVADVLRSAGLASKAPPPLPPPPRGASRSVPPPPPPPSSRPARPLGAPVMRVGEHSDSVPPALRAEDSVPPTSAAEDSVPPALRADDSVPPALRADDSVPPALRADSGRPGQPTAHDSVTVVAQPPRGPASPSDIPVVLDSLSSVPAPGQQDDEVTRIAVPASAKLPREVVPIPSLRPPRGAPARAPLLLDVTPLSLAIETVSGFCESVIGSNSQVPTEQARLFCTSQDYQDEVVVRVCQGEARTIDDNQELGTLHLSNLRRGSRGDVQVAVTFVLDADGMLRAKAQDTTTGNEQEIRINLVGALSEADVDRLRARQDAQYSGKA